MSNIVVGFHTVICVYYLFFALCLRKFSLMTELKNVPEYTDVMLRYNARFYTTWDFAVQTVFFTICFVEHIISFFSATEKFKTKILATRDFVFHTFALPCGLLVTIAFWVLTILDPYSVFPKPVYDVFPPWINHVLHSFISVFIIIEMLLVYHRVPSLAAMAVALTIYDILYISQFMYTYIVDDHWIYPFLHYINWPERIAVFLGVYVAKFVIILSAVKFNQLIWGTPKSSMKKKPS